MGLSVRWVGGRATTGRADDDGEDCGRDATGDGDGDDGGSPRISDTTPGDCPVLGVLMCLNRPLDRRV
ncbi:hypothetical protein GCM10018775_31750 [Streptomyces umbrinus]|nr:hypothetical protein GCM10018775_31750 [Streptomyces umbrinus]